MICILDGIMYSEMLHRAFLLFSSLMDALTLLESYHVYNEPLVL